MKQSKKLLLINVNANTSSTGRIAEQIGQRAIAVGYESYIAYGRKATTSQSKLIRIGKDLDIKLHVLHTRFFDRHGFASTQATKELINEIDLINPDIINLHNLHGYYINVAVLFDYLKKINVPIVWTLHDSWPFTGHCAGYSTINCIKWQTQCYKCPRTHRYPASLFIDNSKENYRQKKELFTNLENLTFVTPSRWLRNNLMKSFLKNYPSQVINNGIDLNIFFPKTFVDYEKLKSQHQISSSKKIILGVTNIWSKGKGLKDFIILSTLLDENYQIVLIGLTDKQIKKLPKKILGIKRTETQEHLANWYSLADVFVNPTYGDTFPTTNLESLACGTPVITYETDGSPEAIDTNTGVIVEKGNIDELKFAIELVLNNGKEFYTLNCRQRAEQKFDMKERFTDYVNLFDSLLNKQ